MNKQQIKIGEPSPEAIDFAKRMIALKWTKETDVNVVAGNWQAGYTFGKMDAENQSPQQGIRWVKVSERLPEKSGEYFVYIDDYKSVSIFADGSFWSNDNKITVNKWLESLPSLHQDGLKEALEKAVEIIKIWHNMPSGSGRLPKEQLEKAWQIYYNHAPEMKPIREALNPSTNPTKQ